MSSSTAPSASAGGAGTVAIPRSERGRAAPARAGGRGAGSRWGLCACGTWWMRRPAGCRGARSRRRCSATRLTRPGGSRRCRCRSTLLPIIACSLPGARCHEAGRCPHIYIVQLPWHGNSHHPGMPMAMHPSAHTAPRSSSHTLSALSTYSPTLTRSHTLSQSRPGRLQHVAHGAPARHKAVATHGTGCCSTAARERDGDHGARVGPGGSKRRARVAATVGEPRTRPC